MFFSARALAGGPGTAAAEFLRLGFGARAVGFGEAFVPVANDVSALYYNPAGLAYPALYDAKSRSGPYEMLAAQSLLVQDIGLTQVGFVRRPFGLSMTYLDLGGIEQRTLETDAPTKAGASDLAVGASYARRIAGVGVGVTGKYIRETIASYSASSYALDLGALRRFERFPVSVGFDLSNAGTPVRFISQSYPLPTTASLGVAYGATRRFPSVAVLQGDLPNGANPDLRIGFEYRGFGPFALRAGYRTYSSAQRKASLGTALGSTASGLGGMYGLSVGVGLRTTLGNLDFALVPYGELGTAYRMSYSLNLGAKKKK